MAFENLPDEADKTDNRTIRLFLAAPLALWGKIGSKKINAKVYERKGQDRKRPTTEIKF